MPTKTIKACPFIISSSTGNLCRILISARAISGEDLDLGCHFPDYPTLKCTGAGIDAEYNTLGPLTTALLALDRIIG